MKNPVKGCCQCLRGYCKCQFAVAFGMGLLISCFCPTTLTLFITAVILVALGIAIARR